MSGNCFRADRAPSLIGGQIFLNPERTSEGSSWVIRKEMCRSACTAVSANIYRGPAAAGPVCAEGCIEWECLCLRAVSVELGTRVPHTGALGPVLTSCPQIACALGKVSPPWDFSTHLRDQRLKSTAQGWLPCLSRSPGDKGHGQLCSASSHLERWAMKACCPGLQSHLQRVYCFGL